MAVLVFLHCFMIKKAGLSQLSDIFVMTDMDLPIMNLAYISDMYAPSALLIGAPLDLLQYRISDG